jgi:glutamate-1-semialdehyde 2,1-aminomutase
MQTMPSNNTTLLEEACRVIPGGVSSSLRRLQPPTMFTRSKVALLFDAEGRSYIDYHAAFGPILLGHNGRPGHF